MIVIKEAAAKQQGKPEDISQAVSRIIRQVQEDKDQAVQELTKEYDGVELPSLTIAPQEIQKAYELVSEQTLDSIKFAADQIRYFATKQRECLQPLQCEHLPGVELGHRLVPVQSCGAYVPAGRYPLPSSALMSIIPAKVAGVQRVAACAPPSRDYGSIHPAVLVAMDLAGADEVYCMGGAQAIAAYAYGTETVRPVDMIVGPGNKYVTEAKKQVHGIVGIDLLAGPSEVLIIADDSASVKVLAVDLLSRCEHDPNAVAVLVTTSREIAGQIMAALELELATLETAEVAARSWEDNGRVLLAEDLEEAVKIANEVGPEHLHLQTRCDDQLVAKLHNYGSLFIGQNTTVAFGDYVAGPNHILPTMNSSRFSNGVWVGTFIRVLSYQRPTKEGVAKLAAACSHLAGVEGLWGHKKAADLRR